MAGKILVVLAVVMLAAGCGTPGTTTAGAPARRSVDTAKPAVGAVAVVEVENFKLTKAEVKELKDASGGKAVLLTSEDSQAEYTVPALNKGTYDAILYGVGQSDSEDAVYVRVAGQAEERVFPAEWKKVMPFGAVRFTQPSDGPCKILLTFGEENVLLDRVEIVPAK